MIDMMLPLFGATETNLFVVSGFNDGGCGINLLSYSMWAAKEKTQVQVHKSCMDGFKVACIFAEGRHFLFFEVRC